MLELKQINKTFNPGTVNESVLFRNFNLRVDKDDFISIVGNNGSGKTSLINIICGSLPLDSGSIIAQGRDITRNAEHIRYRKIGRVYQDPRMGTCTDMTVLENMSLADNKGKQFNLTRGTRKSRIDFYRESLQQLHLNLENKLNVKVGELSGGQRQAMALLMATLTPIEFLILDEHTASLDPKTAELIMELTDQIIREKKVTTLMVTHNLSFAMKYGNRLLLMNQGKIRLDQSGPAKNKISLQDLLSIY